MIVVGAFSLATLLPLTPVITSPTCSPEEAAGVPWYTSQISAPDEVVEPDPVPPVPVPEPPSPPNPPLPAPPLPEPEPEPVPVEVQPCDGSLTPTPMKAGRPMWTVLLALPAAMLCAIDSAVLIGIA